MTESERWRGLAASILHRAIDDAKIIIKYGDKFEGSWHEEKRFTRVEIEKFFKSNWFEYLCEIVEIDSRHIFKALRDYQNKMERKHARIKKIFTKI